MQPLFHNKYLTVKEPEIPLAPGAVEIVSNDDVCKTPDILYGKIFRVYHNLRRYWTENTLAQGCFYLERREGDKTIRQIIPYAHGGMKGTCRQLQVTWNLMCPSLALTSQQLLGDKQGLEAALKRKVALQPLQGKQGNDPFCRADRIAAQQILEKEHVRVLYNYKPLSTHDLLVTAKDHTPTFDEASFIEAMSFGYTAHPKYAAKGFRIMYLTMADHPFAGQTVPHAHVHATFAKDWKEELRGIFTVVRKIFVDSWLDLFPFSPFKLSNKQLSNKIQVEREILGV